MPPQRVFALPRQQSLLLPAVLNPFVLEQKITKAEKIKCALLGLVLLPLRSVWLILVCLVTWPLATLVTFRMPLKGAVEPMKGWRRFVCRTVIAALGRMYFFGLGFRWVVKGKQADSGFLRCLQPVLVSRKDPDSRKNTIKEIESRSTSGGVWPQVLIFPEGTCTNRSCLISFKQGAFIPGVPVQPVILRYPNKLDNVTWTWQGPSSGTLLLLTLCQLYTTVEIEFLPTQIPTEAEKKSPYLFAQKVRGVMAEALGVPVTDHTFEDCRLMISAGELTLPMEAGLVEFTKISRKLDLKWDNIQKELESFAAIANSCKGGRIKIEEFANYLKIPVTPVLQELFNLFDRDGDGTIDFREYVIGVTVLCRPANTEEVIQMAFQLFDTDDDQSISREEFAHMLRSALGVCDLNVTKLFKDIDADGSGHITYSEFRTFALTHPQYAKLFTTYLELQRYQALKGEDQDFLSSYACARSDDSQEESTSDKKDD
ncbi:lysophosphatidylcholine acyltransferase 2 isoform X2 [Alosa alosa]|uniref:lysophosphatidylcholine acyltransferase 2 isoform X2 n=1 Tax=Alosa sapidissima TaxID=34773 RepID=UPI001C099191|nr:lysophosphatidylcholine acyltransferase 2 isoform X2 [Alosa sapidissima]XP_048118963.1 lysophosphatidylcholine acyltransferase 2 isoform X2 [Alosa alosa]